MASYKVELSRSAEKDLRRIDRSMLPAIYQAIESLGEEPRPVGIKKMAGADRTLRIRVGDYRIVYEIENDVLVVFVIRVAHRKDVYR
ncbi:MAG: type II toxin-antitoxin system RelE/ParE family toxin [Candidatus Competibacteraceae bacterium]|nr:type II toxin-antitoxin system RelE/ParE family toxin [Candidatus Competibacteraceae bacterium]